MKNPWSNGVLPSPVQCMMTATRNATKEARANMTASNQPDKDVPPDMHVNLPWSNPQANPLADIRNFKAAALDGATYADLDNPQDAELECGHIISDVHPVPGSKRTCPKCRESFSITRVIVPPDRWLAVCATGYRIATALHLMLRGENVVDIRESPIPKPGEVFMINLAMMPSWALPEDLRLCHP